MGIDVTNDLAGKLPGILAPVVQALGRDLDTLSADEQAAIKQASDALSALLSDRIAQAGSVIQADLAPVMAESIAWRGLVAQVMATGIVGTIGGIPFTIKSGAAPVGA
jgi:hypothetical protein